MCFLEVFLALVLGLWEEEPCGHWASLGCSVLCRKMLETQSVFWILTRPCSRNFICNDLINPHSKALRSKCCLPHFIVKKWGPLKVKERVCGNSRWVEGPGWNWCPARVHERSCPCSFRWGTAARVCVPGHLQPGLDTRPAKGPIAWTPPLLSCSRTSLTCISPLPEAVPWVE